MQGPHWACSYRALHLESTQRPRSNSNNRPTQLATIPDQTKETCSLQAQGASPRHSTETTRLDAFEPKPLQCAFKPCQQELAECLCLEPLHSCSCSLSFRCCLFYVLPVITIIMMITIHLFFISFVFLLFRHLSELLLAGPKLVLGRLKNRTSNPPQFHLPLDLGCGLERAAAAPAALRGQRASHTLHI